MSQRRIQALSRRRPSRPRPRTCCAGSGTDPLSPRWSRRGRRRTEPDHSDPGATDHLEPAQEAGHGGAGEWLRGHPRGPRPENLDARDSLGCPAQTTSTPAVQVPVLRPPRRLSPSGEQNRHQDVELAHPNASTPDASITSAPERGTRSRAFSPSHPARDSRPRLEPRRRPKAVQVPVLTTRAAVTISGEQNRHQDVESAHPRVSTPGGVDHLITRAATRSGWRASTPGAAQVRRPRPPGGCSHLG